MLQIYKNKKNGEVYEFVSFAVNASNQNHVNRQTKQLVIYRKNGTYYVRDAKEFFCKI